MTDCEMAFDKMIQETWWEIILKYNVEITLKYKNKIKKVEIYDPLTSILTKKNKQNDWRVYEKEKLR